MQQLSFQPAQKPKLPFEAFRLSELLARLERIRPADLETPHRMDFHLVYVGLRGRGEVIVDFERVPVGEGWLTVVPRGRVHQYLPQSNRADAWMLIFTPELVAVDLRAPLSLLSTGAGPAFPLPSPRELHSLCEQAAAEYARPDDDLQRPLLASILQTVLLRAERV